MDGHPPPPGAPAVEGGRGEGILGAVGTSASTDRGQKGETVTKHTYWDSEVEVCSWSASLSALFNLPLPGLMT